MLAAATSDTRSAPAFTESCEQGWRSGRWSSASGNRGTSRPTAGFHPGREADTAESAVFSAVTAAPAEGETVTIADGSALAGRTYATRQNPNRHPGRSIAIPASYAPVFKAATTLGIACVAPGPTVV